jgi:hypothetical protein
VSDAFVASDTSCPATLARVKSLLLALIVVALAAPAALATPTATRCMAVTPSLVTQLRHGVKPTVRTRLGTMHAVTSRTRLRKAPAAFGKGVTFVSVRVRGRGTATWAVNAQAFRTGGGFILPVGQLARSIAVFGAALSPAIVSSWGISSRTDGYAQSRAC